MRESRVVRAIATLCRRAEYTTIRTLLAHVNDPMRLVCAQSRVM
jgi:hypothetical protein